MEDVLIHSVELTPQQLHTYLRDFIDLIGKYFAEVRVSIEYVSRDDIFGEGELSDQVCSPKKIIELVTLAEATGRAFLGYYDLSIRIGDDEILFCHHSEIHLPKNPKTQAGNEILKALREQRLVLPDWWLL